MSNVGSLGLDNYAEIAVENMSQLIIIAAVGHQAGCTVWLVITWLPQWFHLATTSSSTNRWLERSRNGRVELRYQWVMDTVQFDDALILYIYTVEPIYQAKFLSALRSGKLCFIFDCTLWCAMSLIKVFRRSRCHSSISRRNQQG